MKRIICFAKKLVSKSELSWKKETLGPLLRNNLNKWEKELSKKEIVLIQLCCKEIINSNYELINDKYKLKWSEKLWVLIGMTLIYCMKEPYIFYRKVRLKAWRYL